ncbi:sec1 family domain-containing protein 1 [Lates japonicus]|uniref:Sec1 family domain-containing protein 1 n=1 Tax=Lates japonicus TaxID=270547 RepID=A0AAD3NIW8_LATJO|nr:sec1 family domain-containing protein 1 [Lates japonicus]
MGITLHLLLHSDRDPIPDVPAVYFVMPTEENIDRICQVFDQYLNFITLEDDMFILCHQNKELISYHAINRADIQDTDMEAIMDTIVDSLFCFFVTLGAVPIIRCPRGNAAEMVAVKLRENLRDARNSLFTGDNMAAGQFSFQRPLFVLADRNVDMATPLHHTWTYQALIHDVLDFHLNRVMMEEGAGAEPSPAGARPKKKSRKTYDLTAADKFWQKHKGRSVQEEEEIRVVCCHFRDQNESGLGEDEGAIQHAVRQHSQAHLCRQRAPSESDLEQYKKALLDAGCDLSPLNYIKQWKAFTKMAATPANYGNSGVKPMGLFSRVMNTGSQFVMEGVKNLVLKQHNLPVTRILDNLMEMKSHPETDDYRYFDPKMLRGSESSIPRNKNPFQEAIVFVVGGGNYIEYQNLVDYTKSKQGKKVVYGCSELFNAAQFIKQLSQLGQK